MLLKIKKPAAKQRAYFLLVYLVKINQNYLNINGFTISGSGSFLHGFTHGWVRVNGI